MATVESMLCSNRLDRKRTHDQMSSESTRLSCNNRHHHNSQNPPTQSTSQSFFNASFPSLRRGFDLRRPVMSGSTANVIDLTGDASSPTEPQGRPHAPPNYEATATRNRPQRFDRSIINVDDQDDGPIGERQESPEIQFLTSRPRSRSLSASRRLDRRRPGLVPTARSPIPRPQFPVRVSAVERIPRQMPADWAALRQFQRQIRGNFGGGGGNDELVAFESHAGGNFPVPGALDFLHAGFNYEQPSRPQHTPRLPTYDAPPAAEHGFTRSPNEDDLLVCARCENELGLGDEDRSQVWVVKACGHVYCGLCAKYRTIRQCSQVVSKGLDPWRNCVVGGCGKSVSHATSMIQVYL